MSSKRGRRQPSEPAEDPAARVHVPLYARLPRGPHHLDRTDVLLNQRARIQGALVQAVARDGYERTSVTHVLGLAGVSRRAFYEQFANREDCLLATFQDIVAGCMADLSRTHRAAGGGHEQRLAAIVDALACGLQRNPSAATFAACQVETAGRHGLAAARRAASAFERLLVDALWADATAPPAPVIRAIVGGGHGIVRAHLGPAPRLAPRSARAELLAWAEPLSAPFEEPLAARIAAAGAASLRDRGHDRTRASAAAAAGRAQPRDAEQRLMRAILRMAVVGRFAELTCAQVADEAGVPADAFFASFTDLDACYAAAQERLAREMLRALDRRPRRGDWARWARAAIERLLRHLCEWPLSAHTLAHGAFAAGAAAVERNHALSREVAARLLDGAPGGEAAGDAHLAAVAGALWHTIGCQIAGGRTQLLPALRDHLAYVVLASTLGSGVAERELEHELQRARTCGRTAERA